MWRNDAIYTSTRTSSADQEFLKDESGGEYCSSHSSSWEDEETRYCLQHEQFDYCSWPRTRGKEQEPTGTASSLHMDGSTTSSYSDIEEAVADTYFYYPRDLSMEGGFSEMSKSMSNESLVEAADITKQSKHDNGYLNPSSELDEAEEVLMACKSHREATESALYPDPIDLDFYPNDSSFISSHESQWKDLVEPKRSSIQRHHRLMVDKDKNQEADEVEESRPQSLGASKMRIQPAEQRVKVDDKMQKLRKCLTSSTLDFLSRVEIIQSTLRELYTRDQDVQRTYKNGEGLISSSPPRLGFSKYKQFEDAQDASADHYGLKLTPTAQTGLITCRVGDLQIAKQNKFIEADDQECNISIEEIFRPCAAEHGTSQNHIKSFSSSWRRALELGYQQQQKPHDDDDDEDQAMNSSLERGDDDHADNVSRSHMDCSNPLPGEMYIVDYFKNPEHTHAGMRLKTRILELEGHVHNLCAKPCRSAILQNVSESALNGTEGDRAPTLAEEGEHLRELAKTSKAQQLLPIMSRQKFPDENENPRETNRNAEEKTGGIFETSKGKKVLDDVLSRSITMSMPECQSRLQEICHKNQVESRFSSLDDVLLRSKTLGVPSFRSVETSQEKQQESSLSSLERSMLPSIEGGQIALRKAVSIPVPRIKSTEDFHGSASDGHMVLTERSGVIEQYKDANVALIVATSEPDSNPRNSIQSQIEGLASYTNPPLPSNELMKILHNWQRQYQTPPAECYPSSNEGPIDESYSRNKSIHTKTAGMVDHTPQGSYLSQYVKTQALRAPKKQS